MPTVHVHPVEDAIEHDIVAPSPDCVCGPLVFPQADDDGTVRELVIHHSLHIDLEGEWIAGDDIP